VSEKINPRVVTGRRSRSSLAGAVGEIPPAVAESSFLEHPPRASRIATVHTKKIRRERDIGAPKRE
jgi:hypothetical protein